MTSSLVLDLGRHVQGCSVQTVQAAEDCSDLPSDWLPQVAVLADELATVNDPRRDQGRRHDLVFLLLLLVMAVLAGATSMAQVLRWAAGVDPDVLAALARGGRTTIPVHSTFSRLLSRLDGDQVDDALARFTAAVLAPGDLLPEPSRPPESSTAESGTAGSGTAGSGTAGSGTAGSGTAESGTAESGTAESSTLDVPSGAGGTGAVLRAWSLDGKTVRGAATATTQAPHLVSVLRHDTNTVAAQRLVDSKTNEITVFQDALNVIGDLRGDVVLADALHTQRAHARYLHARGAFYLFPVAENQPKLFAAVNDLPWDQTPVAVEETGKGHGRTETRLTKVLPAPADLPFPHAAQVILTERITTGRPGGKTQAVAALAITALPARLAGPADLAGHIRDHWKIEANHHVRDVTYREDASQARTKSTPRIMASARNQAINLARIAGFTNIPQANDHYKTRPDQALQLLGLTM